MSARATNIHPQALCESSLIGEGAIIGAFSHIAPGAVLGRNVNIGEHVLVEGGVVLGDGVVVLHGAKLSGDLVVENNVVIGPNVTLPAHQRIKNGTIDVALRRTLIQEGASIGGGAIILAGVTIGREAIVNSGALVELNAPTGAIVKGSPARVTGYIDNYPPARKNLHVGHGHVSAPKSQDLQQNAAHTVSLTSAIDMRGSLVALEFFRDIPFTPRRLFFVFGVPTRDVRGEHAHRECSQFLVCVNGSVRAVTDDGTDRVNYQLDRPDVGLYMPPMTWGTQYAYSDDAVLIVLASHEYDAADYIRSYSAFREELAIKHHD